MQVRKRHQRKGWNEQKVRKYVDIQLDFRTYCQFSQDLLNAPNSFFQTKQAKEDPVINKVLNEEVNVVPREDEIQFYVNKKDDMKNEMALKGREMVDIIKTAWRTIIELVRGRQKNESDPTGMYSQSNIDLHMAQLSNTLRELQQRNYKFELFVREFSYNLAQQTKEINQQLVFIRMLKSILVSRTQQINSKRALAPSTPVPAPEKMQPKRSPLQVVKVGEYFENKRKWLQASGQQKREGGLIGDYEARVRFNAAVLRYANSIG